jgi:cytochrome P450
MNDPDGTECKRSLEDSGLGAPRTSNDEYEKHLKDVLSSYPAAHSKIEQDTYTLIGRYADVEQVTTDWKTFSSARGILVSRRRPEDLPCVPMLEDDPPLHSGWRATLNPFFGFHPVSAHEPTVRGHADNLIDSFIERGSCDFSTEFAIPLAYQTMASFFVPDIPAQEAAALFALSHEYHTGATKEIRLNSWNQAVAYIDEYLRWRAAGPSKADWIDAVLSSSETPTGLPIPWESKVHLISDILGSGTTHGALAGVAIHLSTNPADRQALAQDSSLHHNAIEEIIRVYSTVTATGRYVTTDTEVGGNHFKVGDRLLVFFGAASRDPEKFRNPDRIDMGRRPVKNASFGFGVHRCLGIHLARLQVKVTLEALLSRIPDLTLAEGAMPEYYLNSLQCWTVTSLPMVFSPGEKIIF